MADIQKMTVMLKTIDDVKEFVQMVSLFDFDVDLISGRYAVDAKSIMGIFSLDLSKPIDLHIHSSQTDASDFMTKAKVFEVK